MMNKLLKISAAFLLLCSFAFAAQDTTVIEDNAPVRSEPRDSSEIIEYIPVGSELRISSYPMPGGWYKYRAKTGAYGWINEKFLSVPKPVVNKDGTIDNTVHPERDRRWFLRALGGFTFWRPDDLNAVFGFKDLNTGYMGGGEFGFFIGSRFVVAIRGEVLLKDVVAAEKNTGITYNMALRSYPIMGGFDFYFLKLPAARLSLGVFGGVAYATTFTVEAYNLKSPNTVVLDASPFTALARINLTRPLGRILSVFIEGGYRYLRTVPLSTANAVQGGNVFIKDAVYKPRVIDLSGPTLAIGMGVHF